MAGGSFDIRKWLESMSPQVNAGAPLMPDSLGVPGGVAEGPLGADKMAAANQRFNSSQTAGGASGLSAIMNPQYWAGQNPYAPRGQAQPLGAGPIGKSLKGGGQSQPVGLPDTSGGSS